MWIRLWTLVSKDIVSEWRSKEVVFPAFAFSIIAVTVFGFAFGPDGIKLQEITPGALWVIFTFVAVLILNGSFSVERDGGGLEGVLMSPVDWELIYLGKVIGNVISMFLIEIAVLLFAYHLFFSSFSYGGLLKLLPVTVLGTVGIISVGTLLSAISTGSRIKEIMLPVILIPVVIPVIIASVRLTEAILNSGEMGDASRWIKLIIPFDIIYLSVSSLVFEYVVED